MTSAACQALWVTVSARLPPLAGVRVVDMTTAWAGPMTGRILAVLGAEVIHIEDPVREGRWDILRGIGPYVDERRGLEFGGGYNNHNTQKLGVTINVRTERGKELLTELIRQSDCVTENFAAAYLSAQYRAAIPLVLLIVVIVFRPQGLVGRVEERTV